MDKKKEIKKEEKEMVKYGIERLVENQTLGMKGVDPKDIRPPTVILLNALSKLDSFTDEEGNHPKPGEFFHNGSLRILPEFECYFVWAGKGEYTDKRKPEEGIKQVYRAIGILADDFSIFGMRFKVSSLYTLSPLFTAVSANKRGMYSIKCKLASKFISGKKGEWFIPTLSVVGFENDPEKLSELEKIAMRYDRLGERAAPVTENEEDVKLDEEVSIDEQPDTTKKMNENVNPNDIPF